LTCRKILLHRSRALLLIWRKMCCEFLSPLNSIVSARFQPATLGSSGKHHYTTEATMNSS
jgi:hypothetical protein